MRHSLRKLFNVGMGLVPPFMMRGLLKAFVWHPEYAERAGFQVYPRVFYNPFPDPAEVDAVKLKEKRSLPGIKIDMARASELLSKMSGYASELAQFPAGPEPGTFLWSTTYQTHDTATLYTMLRLLKPKRYIEVGCGYSSRVSTAALNRNRADGFNCESTYIEPYPPAHLAEVKLPGEFIKAKIQEIPLERFQQLESGDLLFIDTSHVIKVQNDVEYELTRVLPALKPGVFVHIHDIFTPYDYPEEWLIGHGPNRGANNEQYALECLLSGGDAWEVVLPVHLFWREQRAELQKLFPGGPDRPAALYIRKRR